MATTFPSILDCQNNALSEKRCTSFFQATITTTSTVHDLKKCNELLGFLAIDIYYSTKASTTFKILNVAVIKIISSRTTEYLRNTAIDIPITIKMHHYNPFEDTYHVASLSEKIALFSNKLQNISTVFRGRHLAYIIIGLDVSIMKTVVDHSNFTVNLKVSDPIPPYTNLYQLNIIESNKVEALRQSEIDFVINSYLVIGGGKITEKSIFLYPISTHAVVNSTER
ncbi:hypothetical protein TSAR_015527 [Trichomalopsis sarcophagae]|uniref:Uncharacterized protein n=1 Tax=Trichomalopsis sarcophagae TaxID=543379 RepID=A0A232EGS3_9HYME|nr:hypothetical protein TSAR_015527 [Trichomalopsis sarcophagae]